MKTFHNINVNILSIKKWHPSRSLTLDITSSFRYVVLQGFYIYTNLFFLETNNDQIRLYIYFQQETNPV